MMERKNNLSEQKDLRRRLRRRSTPEEVVLWNLLKGRQIMGCQFRRQFSVGPYILDFYCPIAKLAIELDGIHHHDDRVAERDSWRGKFLTAEGIEVLRIDNEAIWSCSDMVVDSIEDALTRQLSNLK